MFFQHPVFKTFFSGSAVCVYVYRERMFLRLLRGAKTLLLSPPPKPDSEIEPFHLFPRVLPRRQKDSGLLKGAKKGVAPKRKVNCHRKKMRVPKKREENTQQQPFLCEAHVCETSLGFPFLHYDFLGKGKDFRTFEPAPREGIEGGKEECSSGMIGRFVKFGSCAGKENGVFSTFCPVIKPPPFLLLRGSLWSKWNGGGRYSKYFKAGGKDKTCGKTLGCDYKKRFLGLCKGNVGDRRRGRWRKLR